METVQSHLFRLSLVSLVVSGTSIYLLAPYPSHALSFAQGTIFLEAKTEAECTAQDGDFIEWYGEVYCTQAGPLPEPAPEPTFEEVATAQIEQAAELALVGMDETAAASAAAAVDVPFRIVARNGEMLPVTMDYRPGRINATVENSIVTSYTIEGTDILVTAETNTSVDPEPDPVQQEERLDSEPTPTNTEGMPKEEPTSEPTAQNRSWWRVVIDFFFFWK